MLLVVPAKCPKCNGVGTIAKASPEALRKRRSVNGISLREVARRLKVSAPYISDIERGLRNCTPDILKFYEKLPNKPVG